MSYKTHPVLQHFIFWLWNWLWIIPGYWKWIVYDTVTTVWTHELNPVPFVPAIFTTFWGIFHCWYSWVIYFKTILRSDNNASLFYLDFRYHSLNFFQFTSKSIVSITIRNLCDKIRQIIYCVHDKTPIYQSFLSQWPNNHFGYLALWLLPNVTSNHLQKWTSITEIFWWIKVGKYSIRIQSRRSEVLRQNLHCNASLCIGSGELNN